ncbi:disease resistance protein RGA4-like [Lolium rigidum]|uniref:disease resistance protein RGA4-like n=1 Tax=Lolium rigidum TaxID=89674 RepID=UPI001F5C4596|nr:disease resistance protein RGA4-like [Lolium rigidum]
MEVMRTIGSVMGSIKMLVDLIGKNRELAGEVAVDLKSMNKDFELIRTVRLQRKQIQLQLTAGMELLLQELAYDIDDFIQGLWVPGPFGSFILSAIGADSRPLLIKRITELKESMKKLKDELPNSFEAIPAGPSSSLGSAIPYAREKDLVGIEGPKKQIVELLSPRIEPHLGRLSVISIAGCSGSGKTALARALYEDDAITKDFNFKSWVVASDLSSVDIVNKIRHEVALTSASGSTTEALHHFQKDKRYLVFVDDVLRETPLKDIKNAFSENVMDSRIIVTTKVPCVARDYSFGSYEYTMQGLDKENSRKLFRVKFRGMAGYTEEDKHRLGNNDVDIIINKCDGLPIALISTAECLRRKGLNPESRDFKQVSQDLGKTLAYCDIAFKEFQQQNGTDTTFAEMRRARVEPYENLLNHGEKECLLYVSIFPCGHQINSKNLVRRLIAEGLVPGDPDIVKASESVVGDVRECVRKLMDQHMVEPVPIRNYSNVAKRCRVHSIMLEFTIKKAVSRNFVSLIHKDQPLRSTTGLVRRLSVQSSQLVQGTKRPKGMDLSVLRSLAIFKSRILDFKKCKLVRVLDLEGCRGLTQKDLDNICVLLFLKYLSLRNTGVLELPQNVKKLMFLETLDARDTRDARATQDIVVIKLPVEVIMLPRFTYLFGKFELINMHSNNVEKLIKFFPEKKSQLHTLGGIAVHEEKGLEIILLAVKHATNLKKVKVWYRNTPSSTNPEPRLFRRVMQRLNPPRFFRKRKLSTAPAASPTSNTHDPAPTTSTLVVGGSAVLPSTGQSADCSSNGQDPTLAIPTSLANGTPEPVTCVSRQSNFKNTKKIFSKRKPSADSNSNAQDPAPTTSTPIDSATPRLPSAGLSADSSSNTHDPSPATSTALASDTQELIQCVSRLTENLKEHPMTLESLSIDFNGVSNTFLNLLQTNSTVSSIKLRRGHGSLPSPLELGQVCNLKKLHLFSTGLESAELGALQHLKCLQYLKLAEDGHGLWDSVFHVQVGGFISLIWLCFEATNSKPPPLKIDEGVRTPLASLLLLCKESEDLQTETPVPISPQRETKDPQTKTPVPLSPQREIKGGLQVEGISHLPKLNEVILHPSATDVVVKAWKEEAKKHINMPYVEKQQTENDLRWVS